MARLRWGGWWLGGPALVAVAAIISFLVLTGIGHQVAAHFAAGVTAGATAITAVTAAYNALRQPRVSPAATKLPRRSSVVAVCHVREDTRWAQWCEGKLNEAGFYARVQQLPASDGGTSVAAWAERVAADAACILLIESAWLRHGGPSVERRREALAGHRRVGNRVVYVVTDARESHVAAAGSPVCSIADIDEESAAWRPVEDAVRQCGARPDPRRAGAYRAVGTPSFPGHGAIRANLPPISPNFVGRARELEQLKSALVEAQGDVTKRRVAVHAMSGMGKTQLAVKFASDRQEFETVWWIRAHQSSAIYDDLGSLAQELNIPEVADQNELRRLLWDKLKHARRWLLVYDNAESEEALRDLIPPAGDGSLLITSLSPNWATLATSHLELDHLSRHDAIALLRRRRPKRDDEVLAQIAEQLGWLPLALEQAASYILEMQWTPARYLGRLTRNFSRTLERGSVAYYNESAKRTYEMAREQASKIEPLSGVLLELCGFFSPDAIPRDLFEDPEQAVALPAELAQALSDGWTYDDALSAARRFSLLTVTATSFTMHRVVQRLIRESLGPEVRRARAATALGLLSLAFPDNPDDPRAWEACGALQSHCETALTEVEGHNLISPDSIRLNRLVGEYQRVRGAFELAQKRLNKIAAQLRNQRDDLEESAAIELALARVCYHLPDLDDAKSHALSALKRHEDAFGPESPRTAVCLLELSQIQLELSEYTGAVDNATRSLSIQQAASGPPSIEVGLGLKAVGILQWRLGAWDEAVDYLTKSVSVLATETGADSGVTGYARTALGLVLRDKALDDLAGLTRAQAVLDRAYRTLVSAQGADHPDTLSTAIHLADVQHRRALAVFAGTRNRRELRSSCDPLVTEFERIMESPPMKEKKPGRACGLVRYGHLCNSLGESERARELVQEARGIYLQSYGAYHPYVAEALTRLIDIEYKLNDYAEATRMAEGARRIYVDTYGDQHPYVLQIDAFLTSPGHGLRA